MLIVNDITFVSADSDAFIENFMTLTSVVFVLCILPQHATVLVCYTVSKSLSISMMSIIVIYNVFNSPLVPYKSIPVSVPFCFYSFFSRTHHTEQSETFSPY